MGGDLHMSILTEPEPAGNACMKPRLTKTVLRVKGVLVCACFLCKLSL